MRVPGRTIALGALSLACTTTACERCNPDPPASPDSPIRSPFDPDHAGDPLNAPTDRFALGEWGAATDYRMRALRAENCEVEPYFAPEPGYDVLGVFVEIDGRTAREVPANVLHATLTDSEGQEYEPTLAGCRPAMPAGRVTQGASARGFISFRIPTDAAGLVLHYRPIIVGRASEELRFDLGR